MRNLKNTVFRLQSRNSSLKQTLTILINDDESMALMNLSKLNVNPELYNSPLCKEVLSSHEEIEELLESHLMDCNSLGILMYVYVYMYAYLYVFM
jgi:transcription termination factor NusB